MNQHAPFEGDPPGQIVRLAPEEPRDSQGRTLEQARYQDRSLREADAEQRILRRYRPLFVLDRLCEFAALTAVCLIPASTITVFVVSDTPAIARAAFAVLFGSIVYLFLAGAWFVPVLQAGLKHIREEAQAEGIDLNAIQHPIWRLRP